MKLHFKEFKVYKDTKQLIVRVFGLTRKFPREYYYLSDQVNRSALSIALNIAEGSAKSSDKDFNRYILNSLGSATELVAAIEIAGDLGLINSIELTTLISQIEEVIKQLGGFSKYLKKD